MVFSGKRGALGGFPGEKPKKTGKYTTKTPNNNHNINFKIGNANQIEPNLKRINAKINSNTNSGSSRGIFININNYNSNKK